MSTLISSLLVYLAISSSWYFGLGDLKALQKPRDTYINILYMHTVIHCGGKNEN